MSAGAQLFVVTSMMLVGALGAAYLPYWLRSSGTIREAQIAPISALGAGLLIGCSLGLIIPEGFHSLAGGGGDHAHHHEEGGGGEAYAGLASIFGFLAMMFLEQYQHQDGDGTSHHHHVHHHHHHVPPQQQQQQQQLKGQQDIEISLSKSSSAARLPSSNTTTNTTKGAHHYCPLCSLHPPPAPHPPPSFQIQFILTIPTSSLHIYIQAPFPLVAVPVH